MNRQKFLKRLLLCISFILGLTGISWAGTAPGDGPGQFIPSQGDDHVRPGQSHPPYNTNPPTSGWHYEGTARWGIHASPIPDELQVHNLEHGGIMVQYNCTGAGCAELIENLKQVVSLYKSKVILAPRPNLDTKIALTAWQRIEKFNEFDGERIIRFIEAYKNKGPEMVPD
ncbi:MAG: DUF3105 domain-containing protein [Candidatus Tectomicrobia bacterium]|nr:DUF3105 domain-containing protein [Candidatus Tectomicrobia bacterium]